MMEHLYIIFVVFILSILNTQNGKIITSEIFGWATFSAPMSTHMEAELKFFSLASTIFHGAILFSCQIYTADYLQTFNIMATLGFIFNAITILISVIAKVRAQLKYRKLNENVRSSSKGSVVLDSLNQEDLNEQTVTKANEVDVN